MRAQQATARRRVAVPGRAIRSSIVLAVAALASAGCGSASPTTKSGASPVDPQTLHLTGVPGNLGPGVGGDFTMAYQHGATQFLPGDSFIIWNALTGPGLQVVYCVVSRQRPTETFLCMHTYVLKGGQIDAVGAYDTGVSLGDVGTIAVVGGTGAYVGARGTVTTGNDDPDITIKLN